MALINDQIQEPPTEAPMSEPEPVVPTGQAETGEEPTAVEAKAYEAVVLAGVKLLHNPESSAAFLQLLQTGAEQPGKALSDAAVLLMSQIKEKAPQPIPEAVVLPAAEELLGEVMVLAETAGVFEASETDKQDAVQMMVVSLAKQYGVSQQEVQEFVQSVDMDQVRQNAGPKTPKPQAPQVGVE